MSQKKIKIALLGDTLANGGAERIHSTLSIYLDRQGYEVHNIINLDDIQYPYGGVLYNLGQFKSASFSLWNKAKRFVLFRNYIKQQRFDYIIDFRTRTKVLTEGILSSLVFGKNYLPTVHSSNLNWYLTGSVFWGKRLYRNNVYIIGVSEGICAALQANYGYANAITIHNPIDWVDIANKAREEHAFQGLRYMVACGRMEDELKQFDRLIEVYKESDFAAKGIHLVILGEGLLKASLVQQTRDLGLQDWIHFPGFCANPFAIFKDSLFFVHSSRVEGFPTVLLEALACGTPVISFDCPTGPNEIIQHDKNGLLIENQNFEALQKGMEALAFDENLRLKLKENALESVRPFGLEEIGKKWLNLLR